jgi:hypothetical protein
MQARASAPGWDEFEFTIRMVQLFDVLTTNLDFALVLTRGCEVIGKLHSQPGLGRAAESLRQSYSHLRTNSGGLARPFVTGILTDFDL